MISLDRVKKTFPAKGAPVVALDGVSLSVAAGEFVALVGRSGAGKSTLFNLLAALDRPDSGSIRVDGVEVTRLSPRAAADLRRQKVGVIYQFYNLIPELTVAENITLPRELDGALIEGAAREELAAVIARVGLTGREDDYPATLSGGQQQRVAIARALYAHPAVLLADEPTGNLDPATAQEILTLLREVNRKSGLTVLMITHSEDMAGAADRVVTLEAGRVVSDRRQA